nr:hypothetical protein [Tanacetum cinerariifolium]
MHQPWRMFAAFNQMNVDYVSLLWDDFMYQANNREISSARKERMPYPRFTKVIINHFITKDNTISMRNRINLHTVRDDTLLGTLKFVSKTKDYQKYGALIPDGMINQEIMLSTAYETYLDYATRKVPPEKARKLKKPASSKLKTIQKGKRVKRAAKKATTALPTSVVIRDTPGKSSNNTTSFRLAAQVRELILNKRINLHTVRDDTLLGTLKFVSKTKDYQKYGALIPDGMINQEIMLSTAYETYLDYATRKVPPEKARKLKKPASSKLKTIQKGKRVKRAAKKATTALPTSVVIRDTPGKSSNNTTSFRLAAQVRELILNKSEDESDEVHDEDNNDDDDGNDDDNGNENNGEEDDDIAKELYGYLNITQGLIDIDMTNAEQGREDQQNASHESGFVQEEEDAYVTLTIVHDKTEGIVDNYLASKLKEEVNVAVRLQSNKPKKEAKVENQEFINQVDSTMKKIINEQVKAQVSKIMQQIENYVTESLGAEVLILIHKMETNESINRLDIQRNLYNALVESYNTDKDIISTYGDVVTLKRGRDDQDNDKDPFTGLDRGTKRRKSTQAEEPEFEAADTEMQQNQRNESGHIDDQPDNEVAPKHDWAYFQPTKRHMQKLRQLEYHFEECYKAVNDRLDWHNPEGREYSFDVSKPLPLIEDQGHQVVPTDYFITNDLEYLKGGSSSRKYATSTTRTKAAIYDNIEGIKDMVPTLWNIVVLRDDNVLYKFKEGDFPRLNLRDIEDMLLLLVQKKLSNLDVDVRYDFGVAIVFHHYHGGRKVHIQDLIDSEIVVRRDDKVLYKFKEGNFPRLNLRDIEEMLLLLVQKKLSNLDVDDRYDLGVALRMFTRRIVILHRVEYLQLGVESYQKKHNITRPETTKSNISKLTLYTAYKNPQGII